MCFLTNKGWNIEPESSFEIRQYSYHIGEIIVLVFSLELEAGGDAMVGGSLRDRLQVVRRVAQRDFIVRDGEPEERQKYVSQNILAMWFTREWENGKKYRITFWSTQMIHFLCIKIEQMDSVRMFQDILATPTCDAGLVYHSLRYSDSA